MTWGRKINPFCGTCSTCSHFLLFFFFAENSQLDDLYTRYRKRLRKSLFISGLGISLVSCLISIILCSIGSQVNIFYNSQDKSLRFAVSLSSMLNTFPALLLSITTSLTWWIFFLETNEHNISIDIERRHPHHPGGTSISLNHEFALDCNGLCCLCDSSAGKYSNYIGWGNCFSAAVRTNNGN